MQIKPLTHKMKNRVREHGSEWYVVCAAKDNIMMISPVPHQLRDEPYMIWVTPGKEIEILNENSQRITKV